MIIVGRPKTGRPEKDSYRGGRSKKLCIRISDKDLRHLEMISDFYGMSKTDFVISKIDEEIRYISKVRAGRVGDERK